MLLCSAIHWFCAWKFYTCWSQILHSLQFISHGLFAFTLLHLISQLLWNHFKHSGVILVDDISHDLHCFCLCSTEASETYPSGCNSYLSLPCLFCALFSKFFGRWLQITSLLCSLFKFSNHLRFSCSLALCFVVSFLLVRKHLTWLHILLFLHVLVYLATNIYSLLLCLDLRFDRFASGTLIMFKSLHVVCFLSGIALLLCNVLNCDLENK